MSEQKPVSQGAENAPQEPMNHGDAPQTPMVAPGRARKSAWVRVAVIVLFVALLVALGVYVYRKRTDMAALLSLDAAHVAWLLGLSLLVCVLNALYHRTILRFFGLRLTLTDWLGVSCVRNAASYVAPLRADLALSAAYYKQKNGLAYAKSMSIAAGNIVFGAAICLMQIFASLFIIGLWQNQWNVLLWGVCLGGIAFVLLFVWVARRAAGKENGWIARHALVARVVNGFNALLHDRQLLLRLLLVQVFINGAQLAMFMVAFDAIGYPVTVVQALLYSGVNWLTTLVAVVPGNIGVKESLMGVASLCMGSAFDHGVMVTLLVRVAEMLVYCGMALIFALPVYRALHQSAQKENKP